MICYIFEFLINFFRIMDIPIDIVQIISDKTGTTFTQISIKKLNKYYHSNLHISILSPYQKNRLYYTFLNQKIINRYNLIKYLEIGYLYDPIDFSELKSLKKLQWRDATGTKECAHLPSSLESLIELDCSFNPFLTNINNLTNLKILKCVGSGFSNKHTVKLSCDGISNLVNLESLNCSNNCNIINITSLTNLTKLNCGGVNNFISDLRHNVNLRSLDCIANKWIKDISFLTNLNELKVYNQDIHLDSLTNLTSLYIDQFLEKNLNNFVNLRILSFGYTVAFSVEMIKDLTQLEELYLTGIDLYLKNIDLSIFTKLRKINAFILRK